MGAFDEELARREAARQYEAAMEVLIKARQRVQDEFNAAMERHEKHVLETQRRQEEKFLEYQQCQERIRREDAEQDAADALAQQQLWELFVKAVTKPTSVKASEIIVPLAPDRDLAQVKASESSGEVKTSDFDPVFRPERPNFDIQGACYQNLHQKRPFLCQKQSFLRPKRPFLPPKRPFLRPNCLDFKQIDIRIVVYVIFKPPEAV